MKFSTTLTLCLFALGVTARGEEPKITYPGAAPAPAAPAAAAAPTFTDAQLVEEFGWFIGKRVGIAELGFSQSEIAALVKGLQTAAAGKDSPYELDRIGPQMDDFMQKKQTAYLAKLKQENAAASTAFFAKLKENKNVVELPSGLRYEIVQPGQGPSPKPNDTVTVHYTGTLLDGTVFDSSRERNKPEEFPLDAVISGWTEGIQKINKGGKIKLYVPSQLAYGDEGRPGIPPGSTLLFDVELLDFKPTPPAPTTPAMPVAPPTK
jgi:FKBP-type peptidyl-prolyl cis-trans isomerase